MTEYIKTVNSLVSDAVNGHSIAKTTTADVSANLRHANDRNYTCECGFHIHRDLLGAMNICNSTEFVGDRQTA